MTASAQQRITLLIDRLRVEFPRRKRAIEELFGPLIPADIIRYDFHPPEPVRVLPTFDPATQYSLTPMLQARFDYASTCQMMLCDWLAAADMESRMRSPVVQEYHLALRAHWQNSAPMLFPDDRQTLFGLAEDIPDSLIYLVWRPRRREPELWSYSGFEARQYKNLEAFLTSELEIN